MDGKLQTLDYLIIGLMMILSSAVGIYFRFTGGRQKTIEEYLMADKRMSMFPVSVSLMAAFMSANSVLGIPAETYLYGTQYSMWVLGSVFGSIIAMYGFLPVYFDLRINSVNEYLGTRFGSATRAIVAALQIIRTIFYTAVVLYAPSLALSAITGISIWTATISMAFVCTFYCSLGGIKAVVWTDIFQAFLMCITLIAVIAGVTQSIGFFEIIDISKAGGRFVFFDFNTSLIERYTFWNCAIYGLFTNLSAFGATQTELQRIFSIKGLRKGQMSILLCTFYNIIFTFLCVWSGIVIYALYKDCDPMLSSTENISPDELMPLTIMKLFKDVPGLSGLCVAGIFSAALSTISSAINGLTSITVEDFLKPYIQCKCFNNSRMAYIAKILAVAYGVFCLCLSFIVAHFRGVLEANVIMSGMIGGPVTGIFILGMLGKYVNQRGALFGLLSGSAFGLWSGFGTYIVRAEVRTLPRSISGCTLNKTVHTEFFYRNNSFIFESLNNETGEAHSHEERYVFPLYEVAYLWVPIFSCLITIICGAMSSSVEKFFRKESNANIYPKKRKSKDSSKATSKENLTSGMVDQRNFRTFEDVHMN